MPIHNFRPEFEGNEKRYRVKYDKVTDVWRVLDLWDESLTTISDVDAILPDDHPALKVLSGATVTAILREVERLGWGERSIPRDEGIAEEIIGEEEITSIGNELEKHAIDTIAKIVGLKGISKLGR